MTQQQAMGRRRSDRVLHPSFVVGLAELSNDELLTRRDDAIQEESDVSYIRRLIQGRLDLLKFEQERRRGEKLLPEQDSSGDDAALVKALTSILTDKSRPESRGTQAAGIRAVPVHAQREPEVSAFSRRSAEAAVADVRFSDLKSLSDDELTAAIEQFSELEKDVSTKRTAVQYVADTLSEAVESRVADGAMSPGSV